MGIYIEAVILYVVLFFSGSVASTAASTGETAGFSITAELAKIFIYSIPSLTLIWYLLLKAKPLKNWEIVPGKKDLTCCIITLSGLLIIGLAIAFVSSYMSGPSAQVLLYSPSTPAGWIVLCFSLIIAAYTEESFFRFYLLSRKDELKMSAAQALMFSVLLFSICHIYEGPWGFLNAALSGTFLCFIFLRYKSIHGISVAHGFYNIAIYIINTART
ncbi:MAG: CPBP family intramembrane metalloprotease [Treponema sp.]|nr:CPBP family intramembrane metalloprotease [Treponema sp.]